MVPPSQKSQKVPASLLQYIREIKYTSYTGYPNIYNNIIYVVYNIKGGIRESIPYPHLPLPSPRELPNEPDNAIGNPREPIGKSSTPVPSERVPQPRIALLHPIDQH